MSYFKNAQLGRRFKNKFGAVKQTYNGFSYDSKLESNKAFELDLLLKAKKIKSWSKQEKIELYGENKTKICNYFVDFTIVHNGAILDSDIVEYLEIKSPATKTSTWRLKWKLMQDKFKNNRKVKMTVEG